jgi:hypothetical protein
MMSTTVYLRLSYILCSRGHLPGLCMAPALTLNLTGLTIMCAQSAAPSYAAPALSMLPPSVFVCSLHQENLSFAFQCF